MGHPANFYRAISASLCHAFAFVHFAGFCRKIRGKWQAQKRTKETKKGVLRDGTDFRE